MKKSAKFLICIISTFIILGICSLPALSISADASSSEIVLLQVAVSHLRESVEELEIRLDEHIESDTVANGEKGEQGEQGIQGEPGADGITPQLRIGSGNIWEVSYDNGSTWESLGVSAVGVNGKDGKNGTDGKDGEDGKDGVTPVLKFEDNVLFVSYDNGKTWTELGVISDVDGEDGKDGEDGITPQLRINEDTNMWEVSYDNGTTWTSMGVEATGSNGSNNILPLIISCISLAGMVIMFCMMMADRKKSASVRK